MSHARYPQPGLIPTVKGPSTGSIVDAYKYAYDKEYPRRVTFTDTNGNEYVIMVSELMHEDGSGNSHLFRGHLLEFRMKLPDGTLMKARIDNSYVKGYWYAGANRRGHMEFSSTPWPR